jgi:hypothetical protein
MAINCLWKIIITVLVAVLLTACRKYTICPKMGYEFLYDKPGCLYTPISDSIPIGASITITAAAPRTFYDEEKKYIVTDSDSTINGPLRIIKLMPTEGVIEDMILTPEHGKIVKDTILFSDDQLKSFRTVYWDGNSPDSFKLKIHIRPKIKGIFVVNLGQQSSRSYDCALYKYFLKIRNTDQHLYFLEQANNGSVSDYERNYTYCFKVY